MRRRLSPASGYQTAHEMVYLRWPSGCHTRMVTLGDMRGGGHDASIDRRNVCAQGAPCCRERFLRHRRDERGGRIRRSPAHDQSALCVARLVLAPVPRVPSPGEDSRPGALRRDLRRSPLLRVAVERLALSLRPLRLHHYARRREGPAHRHGGAAPDLVGLCHASVAALVPILLTLIPAGL